MELFDIFSIKSRGQVQAMQKGKVWNLLNDRLIVVRVLLDVTGKSGNNESSSTFDKLMLACQTF